MASSLTLLRGTSRKPPPDSPHLAWSDLIDQIRLGKLPFRRYQSVTLWVPSVSMLNKPFLSILLIRLISRQIALIHDDTDARVYIGWREVWRAFWRWVFDAIAFRGLLARLRRRLQRLEQRPAPTAKLDLMHPVIYLKADLQWGLISGGAVAHTAGVLNQWAALVGTTHLFTPHPLPLIAASIHTHQIPVSGRFRDLPEGPQLAFNETAIPWIIDQLSGTVPAFLYHRYALHCLAGVALADHYRVPLVLEFNGSEVWVARHWGSPLIHEELAQRIERLNLQKAQVVVVVSQPLKDSLVAQGVDPDKILVNPNGVDPHRYTPAASGAALRRQLNLERRRVIGFLGSFGPWHGVPVLVKAFAEILKSHPDTRLLLVGDGVEMAKVQAAIREHGIQHAVTVTGSVPQAEGPAYLAACDILASPHVPNPDGSPFFGSPTKLFEYMAMGKGIVASRLGQIAEILEHNRTAWLVAPGSVESLAQGLGHLLDHPELAARLGQAAREQVLAHHTWEQHTRKILDKLKEICG